MSKVTVHKTYLAYKASDSLIVSVFDASGFPVDLTEEGTKIGIAIARSNHPIEEVILEKQTGDEDVGLVDGTVFEAVISFKASDYDNGVLSPRLFGYWFTIWYRMAGETDDHAILTGPLMIQQMVPIEFN